MALLTISGRDETNKRRNGPALAKPRRADLQVVALARWLPLDTYVVKMRLHVDKRQSFLEEDYKHAAWDSVFIEAVLMHVCLLGEHKRRVLEPCNSSAHAVG